MRLRRSRTLEFAWGFVDQGLASAVTFLLTVAAARSLGPAGVGTIAVGYSAFLVVLGLERALIIDPFLTSVHQATDATRRALAGALSSTIVFGLTATAIFLVLSATFHGTVAAGMNAFAPWLTPALVQALLRAAAFRAEAGRIAALSSVVWITSLVVLMAAGARGSATMLATAWGVAAILSITPLLLKTAGVRLAAPQQAYRWFTQDALSLGRWLASASIVSAATSYALMAAVTVILGAAAVGGYRAIESAFSFLSLIGMALANPGIRAMQHEVARGRKAAARLTIRLSALAGGLAVAYTGVLAAAQSLVWLLYGQEFRSYSDLILPIALGQAVLGATGGVLILLKSQRRGRDITVIAVATPLAALSAAIPLALVGGLNPMAWGIAASTIVPFILAIVFGKGAIRTIPEAPLSNGTDRWLGAHLAKSTSTTSTRR